MSTYTPSLGLELITPGSQAGLWGNTTNNTFNLIDQAVTGVTPLSFASASGTTQVLTDYNGAEDQARAAVLNITGTATGPNTVVIPNKQKTYMVRNGTGQDITFQTPTATTPTIVPAGNNTLIFCDGNNGVFPGILVPGAGTLGVNGGGTGVTTFAAGFVKSPGGTTALTSSPTVALNSEVSGTLPIANGGTGLSSLTANSVLLVNGSGAVTPTIGGASGQVLTWNGTAWAAATPSSAGVTSIAGNNIGVSPATGAVTITLSSSNVTSALGYTPVSPSTLSSYAPLASPTFSGTPTSSAWGVPGGGFIGTGAYPAISVTGFGTLFSFQSNGNGYAAGSWVNSSDSRLKENVSTIQDGLEKIGKINPVKFSFKRDGLSSANHYGVIAQEFETVIPELVHTSGLEESGISDLKAVSYTEIIPILIKAIQELKAEVDALKAAK